MYLTFDEYSKMGGQLNNAAFTRKEARCRKLLDYWTQNRIKTAGDTIKELMFEMVETEEREVKSFSNDGVSVTYEQTSNERLYELALAYLPLNLTCLGVSLDVTNI